MIRVDAGVSTQLSAEPIRVDIWSDIACPWCFIGKRRFEAAVAESGIPVEVEYHSYQLDPNTPIDVADSHDTYLAGHLGVDIAQVRAMSARVAGIAETAGLHYDFDAMQDTNTLLGHQLLHYAKARGLQAEVKEILMSAHFERGQHVGRIPELADLAAQAGLDRDDVIRSLESGEYVDAVRQDVETAAELGIRGVPFFVLDGKYGVSGAQETATFVDVLGQVAAQRASADQEVAS